MCKYYLENLKNEIIEKYLSKGKMLIIKETKINNRTNF